jgi:hypothetical protein
MLYIITSIIFLIIGFKLGTKYTTLTDILHARRISKMMELKQKSKDSLNEKSEINHDY